MLLATLPLSTGPPPPPRPKYIASKGEQDCLHAFVGVGGSKDQQHTPGRGKKAGNDAGGPSSSNSAGRSVEGGVSSGQQQWEEQMQMQMMQMQGDGSEGDPQQQQNQQQPHQLMLRQDRADRQEEPPSMHHGGDFAAYMQLKNTKLREQFETHSFQTAPRSTLFQGVAIHVNGYTQPTHAELRQLMAMHGGRFEVCVLFVSVCVCVKLAIKQLLAFLSELSQSH